MTTRTVALPAITERAFQSQVVHLARLLGWMYYHTHDARNSVAGFPDLCLVRRHRVLFVELKAEKGKVSAAQQSWIDALREAGQAVFVWRPSDWSAIEATLR